MSEDVGAPTDHPGLEREFEPTGNAAVDEVVESLEQLEGAPVSEQVQAFEAAHEKLRDALGGADDDNPRLLTS